MEQTKTFSRRKWNHIGISDGTRELPEEMPIAVTYDGGSYAVMMATPSDLEDFAVGFSLTEGIIATLQDIRQIEIVSQANGIELRIWLARESGLAHLERKRRIVGPTGCGLCGIESLEQAVRLPPAVEMSSKTYRFNDVLNALALLPETQFLNIRTRATHASAFYLQDHLIAVREDVGRHNALDKLCGTLLRDSISVADGMLLTTSRVSIEMIQKAASIGAQVVIAVSAPTALAIRAAESCGITLLAIARNDGFEVFTHDFRICD